MTTSCNIIHVSSVLTLIRFNELSKTLMVVPSGVQLFVVFGVLRDGDSSRMQGRLTRPIVDIIDLMLTAISAPM